MDVGLIEFGEIDAKNEVFKQKRSGKSIFKNSFQVPPGLNIDSILRGESFFVHGQKGCGKTALLLYLQEIAGENGWATDTTLFRSGLSEAERQEILAGSVFSVVNLQENSKINYDFLFNWLWNIYSTIVRKIDPSWVIDGFDILRDLKSLFKVNDDTRVKAFDSLTIKSVNTKAKLALSIPYFTAELSSDIESIKDTPKEKLAFEIIQICERYIDKIRLNPRNRVLIFFDELELFWNKPDQRKRDLRLIRDLLSAVSRVNRNLNALGASIVVYASVRSEVLEEVNVESPEIAREVDDFGVQVNWNVSSSSDNQTILKIVESKIIFSEIEHDNEPSDAVWDTYFPESLYGYNAEDYLLDTCMFKPRLIVMRLNFAKIYDRNAEFFSAEAFEQSGMAFSSAVWREVSEQLAQSFSPRQLGNLKEILTAWNDTFSMRDIEVRVSTLNREFPGISDGFNSTVAIRRVLKALYEAGAVGNRFIITNDRRRDGRDRWYFRGYFEPAYDRPFVIHESLRKYFQLIHD